MFFVPPYFARLDAALPLFVAAREMSKPTKEDPPQISMGDQINGRLQG